MKGCSVNLRRLSLRSQDMRRKGPLLKCRLSPKPVLCRFHGIEPSKNKKAKKQKKFAEEQAKLRAATSESRGSLERLKQVQVASKSPYLVLDGTVKPGQISDPASGYATSGKAVRGIILC